VEQIFSPDRRRRVRLDFEGAAPRRRGAAIVATRVQREAQMQLDERRPRVLGSQLAERSPRS
jgi:hypothetical protein